MPIDDFNDPHPIPPAPPNVAPPITVPIDPDIDIEIPDYDGEFEWPDDQEPPPQDPVTGEEQAPAEEILDALEEESPNVVRSGNTVIYPVPRVPVGSVAIGTIISVILERRDEIEEAIIKALEGILSETIEVIDEYVVNNQDEGRIRIIKGLSGGTVTITWNEDGFILNAEPAPETEEEPIPDLPVIKPDTFPDVEPANDPEYDPEEPEPIIIIPPIPSPDREEEDDPYEVIEIPLPERAPNYEPGLPPDDPRQDPVEIPYRPYPEHTGPEQWERREYPPGGEPREYEHPGDGPLMPLPPVDIEIPPPYDKEMPDGTTKKFETVVWYEVEWTKPYPGTPVPSPVIVVKARERPYVEPEASEEAQEVDTQQEQAQEATQPNQAQNAPQAGSAPQNAPAGRPATTPRALIGIGVSFTWNIAAAVLQNIFGNLNPIIATRTSLTVEPRGKIELKNEVIPKSETYRERTQTNEGKMAHQTRYMAALFYINKYWGPVSEALDFANVVKENLIIDGNRVSKWEDWTDLFNKVRNAQTVDIDLDGLMVDAFEEYVTDMLIGQMSQYEKELLLRKFGDSHLINNMMGSPTTWARRLARIQGERLPSPVIDELKLQVDTARKQAEKMDRMLDKVREDLSIDGG